MNGWGRGVWIGGWGGGGGGCGGGGVEGWWGGWGGGGGCVCWFGGVEGVCFGAITHFLLEKRTEGYKAGVLFSSPQKKSTDRQRVLFVSGGSSFYVVPE